MVYNRTHEQLICTVGKARNAQASKELKSRQILYYSSPDAKPLKTSRVLRGWEFDLAS